MEIYNLYLTYKSLTILLFLKQQNDINYITCHIRII